MTISNYPAAAVLFVTLSLTSMAQAAALRCDGTVHSAAGGAVHASRYPNSGQFFRRLGLPAPRPEPDPIGIDWRPLTKGSPIEVLVYWSGGLVNPPAAPDTLQIDFEFKRPVPFDTLTTEIAIQDGPTWQLPDSPSSEEAKVWSLRTLGDKNVEDGQIHLSNESDIGRTILSGIALGKSIHLIVRSAKSILVDTTVYTSGASDRDKLIKEIRAKIRDKDPAVCTDKPEPINYLTPPPSDGKPVTYTFECIEPDGRKTIKTLKTDKPPKYSICD